MAIDISEFEDSTQPSAPTPREAAPTAPSPTTQVDADTPIKPPWRTMQQQVAGKPDLTNAPARWKAASDQIMNEATRGLNEEDAARMRLHLTRVQIEYDHKARALQLAALQDNARAGLDQMAQVQVENASRLDRTDAEAFESVDSRRGAIAGALINQASGGTQPDALHGAGLPANAAEEKAASGAPLGGYEQTIQDSVAKGIISTVEGPRTL